MVQTGEDAGGVTSVMEGLEGVVDEECGPHDRLGDAEGVVAHAGRVLPVPHHRADQPRP
jgi:hypothetical protein